MKVTYRWMKEYLPFDISPREMIDRLVMIGHEVGDIVDLGMLDNPIRIARIARVEPHSGGEEHLTLCTVDDGGEEPIQVVCGAPNAKEGLVTVLARAGARLPDGKIVRRAKIRGVASDGMLLAPDEMGLGSDHSGLIVLDDKAVVGEGYDLIFDVELTPNRPDCLSVFGLARDLAASYNRKTHLHPPRFRETYEDIAEIASVSVKCPDDCPRYSARVIKNVRVGPSPDWLRLRLLAVGLRPINNVVDATNVALMEMGHPLHAFDYDKIDDHQIVVRLAQAKETIRLLDGTVLDLAAGKDMVIADANVPVALAGIMGGLDSEVSDKTKHILLESAYFNPRTVRRTAARHRLSTEASYRFERGADQNITIAALDYCAALIAQLADGEIPKGIVDRHPKVHVQKALMLRPARACSFLGVDIPKTLIADILANLGFDITRSEADVLVVNVPSYRVDVAQEEDLYEEIVRLYGYDKLPPTLPSVPASSESLGERVGMERILQDHLAGMGYCEAINYSFTNPERLEELGFKSGEALRILNPISRDHGVLRTTLVHDLIRNAIYNQNRGNPNLKLFECGSTFHFGDMAAPCVEKDALALIAMGARRADWRASSDEIDFFDVKGDLEELLDRLGIRGARFVPGGPGFLHEKRKALIFVEDEEIGWLGELDPTLRYRYDFKPRPLLAQLQIDALRERADFRRHAVDLPPYPAVERDLALVIDSAQPAAELEATIRREAGELLETLFLFDCYEGDRIAPGKKSLAYRAAYRHAERTLTDDEVDAIQTRIVAAVGSAFGAVLRT
ncbi:phenylalanine--tRNA ligase subunit beta [Candidatus Sumerlaeota bacterium]|nr:phenylalanine--tRNA ligase subunit beta [Candidatus Sumerlaeota bacterium]